MSKYDWLIWINGVGIGLCAGIFIGTVVLPRFV